MASCIFKNEIPQSKEALLTQERENRSISNVVVNEAGKLQVEEIISGTTVLATDTEEAKKLLLERNQYRYKGKMSLEDDIGKSIIEDKMVRIEQDDEYKRMYVHKLNFIPTGEKDDYGNYIYNVTAVFTMVDNPVWLVPALWALTAVGGSVGGWFLVDKFEEFTSTSTGSLVTIGLTVVGLFISWKAISG